MPSPRTQSTYDQIPAAIASMVAAKEQRINEAYLAFPLKVLAGLFWSALAVMAVAIDFEMLRAFWGIQAQDINTGTIPPDKMVAVFLIAMQGVVAVAGLKLFVGTRRKGVVLFLVFGAMIFGISLTILSAIAALPSYLSVIEGFVQSAFSWTNDTKPLVDLAQFAPVYSIALIGAHTPFLMVPVAAALFFALASDALSDAIGLYSKRREFRRQKVVMESKCAEAEEAWDHAEQKKPTKAKLLAAGQTRITADIERVQEMARRVEYGALTSPNELRDLFAGSTGIPLPAEASGLFHDFYRDPHKARALIEQARDLVDHGYLDRVYADWVRSRGHDHLQ